jgi:hypothetical protein
LFEAIALNLKLHLTTKTIAKLLFEEAFSIFWYSWYNYFQSGSENTMRNYQTTTAKAIALFFSLSMMSSLVGCDVGETGEGEEGGEGDAIEQPADEEEEEGEDD